MQAMAYRSVSIGESFHTVSPAALSLRGYAEAVGAWFGKITKCRFLSWDEWRGTVSKEESGATWTYCSQPNCSIAKARRLLDYQPRYSSLAAVHESLRWLIEQRIVTL